MTKRHVIFQSVHLQPCFDQQTPWELLILRAQSCASKLATTVMLPTCWWQRYISDFMKADVRFWWQNHYDGDIFKMVVIFLCIKSITNVPKLSPIQFVSYIRHQNTQKSSTCFFKISIDMSIDILLVYIFITSSIDNSINRPDDKSTILPKVNASDNESTIP